MVKLSAIQLCSVPNVEENLVVIETQLAMISTSQMDDHLVVLPECCLYFGGKDKDQLLLAQNAELARRMQQGLAKLAQQFGVYLVAGSIPVASTTQSEQFANTSLLISPQGKVIGDYQKLHLFDVEVEDKEKSYQESRYTSAGKQVSFNQLPFAGLGMSICYDLRFPELYRQLSQLGADIITVPAAFTRVTGKAHWQALLQARAIENQVYIVAAGQEGVHANGRETWGHSMIISPWGEIIEQLPAGVGSISAEFQPALLNKVRNSIPVAQHNRFKTELIDDE